MFNIQDLVKKYISRIQARREYAHVHVHKGPEQTKIKQRKYQTYNLETFPLRINCENDEDDY